MTAVGSREDRPSRGVLYVDESGVGGSTGVMLMSGLLAPDEAWARFEQEWEAVLDEPPRVTSFHMTDAFGGRRQFKAWSRKERDRRLDLLSSVIVKHVTCSCTVYLSIADYEQYVRGRVAPRFDDPFFTLFVCMVSGLFNLRHDALQRVSPIDVIIDYQQQFGSRALSTTDSLWPVLTEEEAKVIGTVSSRPKGERLIPLEAADMLAWCQHRKLTKSDGAHLPVWRKLVDQVPKNHRQADADFLRGYVRSGYSVSGAGGDGRPQ